MSWPLWALPFWTMGVPLIWAIYELKRIPKADSAPTHFGWRPLVPVPAP